MEIRTIFYENKNWEYFIDYKQQKNMYLKLKGEKIVVSAPFFVKLDVIENFVLENLPKLISKIENQTLVLSKISFFPESFIYFLDQKLRIIIKYHKRTNFFISDDVFFIYTSLSFLNQNEQLLLLKKMNNFLKKVAEPIFLERLHYWENKMHLKITTLEIRLMKNKWGVCFLDLQKITLNTKLIHFSYQVIDYVIIHELAHLIHSNHGKEFWNLVSLYCQEYKSCKHILKYSNVGITNENH